MIPRPSGTLPALPTARGVGAMACFCLLHSVYDMEVMIPVRIRYGSVIAMSIYLFFYWLL